MTQTPSKFEEQARQILDDAADPCGDDSPIGGSCVADYLIPAIATALQSCDREAREQEREACAKVAEDIQDDKLNYSMDDSVSATMQRANRVIDFDRCKQKVVYNIRQRQTHREGGAV